MSETDEQQQTALDADERIRDARLDRAIAAVVEEEPPPGSERTAGERVSRALGLAPIGNSQLTDYQALIPDYLAGNLTDAQRLLFEDEAATSIPLRRALAAARGGAGGDRVADLAQPTAPMPARRPVPAGPRTGRLDRHWIYGIAAAAVVAIAAVLAIPTFDRPDPVRVARVEAVEGTLLRQAGTRWMPLAQDEWLDDGQRLATKQGGTAVIALQDGSKVEVAPRSQLRLTRAGGGNRVRVDQGNVIVQVAPQRDGTFDIATDDLVVAVVGTTLGVGHGTKGSRVAVIEGEVEVRHGGKTTSLKAGDQYGTGKTTAMALEETVAWSRDAERYAEILRAYAEFHRDFGEALTAGNRHSTRLLDLVPAQTSIYVAVPNAPATIAEAYEAVVAFHDQLPAGELPVHATTATVEAVVGWLGEIGEHLGPETVLALHWEEVGSLARSASNRPAKEAASKVASNDDLARHSEPPVLLVLAEARPSLRQVIEDKLVEAARAVGHPDIGVDLVDEPQQAREGRLGIWLDDGLFAASPTPSALVELQAVLDGGANPFRDGELFARLVEVYERGAEYVAGADLAKLGLDGFHDPLVDFRGARTAVVEHRLDGERGFAALEVRFDHDDPDRVALLDQPGPMGALRFFSPDATLASAVVLPDSEKLRAVLNAWLRDSPAARGRQSAMPELVESLIGMLGGEIAVALDGPLLPQPSWKAVVRSTTRRACSRRWILGWD